MTCTTLDAASIRVKDHPATPIARGPSGGRCLTDRRHLVDDAGAVVGGPLADPDAAGEVPGARPGPVEPTPFPEPVHLTGDDGTIRRCQTRAMSAIDDLLRDQPDAERAAMHAVVETAQRLAPDAVHGVTYGVPALLVAGRPLVGLSARSGRLALYPFSPAALDTVRKDLAGWSVSKGTVRFSARQPVPPALLERLLAARLAEIRG